MTDQERNQVLKMIEDGKITPEEGLHLMQALDQNPAEGPVARAANEAELESTVIPIPETASEPASPPPAQSTYDPRAEKLKETVRRLWQIPLWIGILVTVASALGMYAILQGPGLNFWFYFILLPLLMGVTITAVAVGSRQARWIFVDVRQKPGERPERIFLGFPLPLKFTAWFVRTFGRFIPQLQKTNVDEVIQILNMGFSGSEPLIVNVDEGEGGERVKVYIG